MVRAGRLMTMIIINQLLSHIDSECGNVNSHKQRKLQEKYQRLSVAPLKYRIANKCIFVAF